MRKQRLSYQIAGILIIIATLGFTITYFYQKNTKAPSAQKSPSVQQTEIAKSTEEPSKAVSKTVQPKKQKVETEKSVEEAVPEVAETSSLVLHFPEEIAWPIEGKVLLNYSMNQTVYFETLKQYQYNPAMIISGKVNDPVSSVCAGKVVSILNDAKTGTTLTMDIGDGYQAVYGQLKEIPVATGEYVAKGQCIGYINEPSKYYLSEGSNLYFQLLKDKNPINPQDYLEH